MVIFATGSAWSDRFVGARRSWSGRIPPRFVAVRLGSWRQVSSPGRPGETRDERDDCDLADLLQELRVATLGVRVLFGFLLGLPFTSHFSALHAWQRGLPAIVLAVLTAGMFGGLWFALPAARRERISRPREEAPS